MNNYTLQIIADLKQRRTDVERTYRGAREAWEVERVKQRCLIESAKASDWIDYTDELGEVSNNLRSLFDLMERLDEESNALFDAIKAIEKASK